MITWFVMRRGNVPVALFSGQFVSIDLLIARGAGDSEVLGQERTLGSSHLLLNPDNELVCLFSSFAVWELAP